MSVHLCYAGFVTCIIKDHFRSGKSNAGYGFTHKFQANRFEGAGQMSFGSRRLRFVVLWICGMLAKIGAKNEKRVAIVNDIPGHFEVLAGAVQVCSQHHLALSYRYDT